MIVALSDSIGATVSQNWHRPHWTTGRGMGKYNCIVVLQWTVNQPITWGTVL